MVTISSCFPGIIVAPAAVRSPQRRRACCEFGSKSACILWFFATCASKLWFCDKIARLLWFLQLCFLDFFTAQLINEITYFPPCPLDPLFMVSWLFYVSMHIGRVENVSMIDHSDGHFFKTMEWSMVFQKKPL